MTAPSQTVGPMTLKPLFFNVWMRLAKDDRGSSAGEEGEMEEGSMPINC